MQENSGRTARLTGQTAGIRYAREHAHMSRGMLVEPGLRAAAELAWKCEGRRPTSTAAEMRDFVRGFVEAYRAGAPDASR